MSFETQPARVGDLDGLPGLYLLKAAISCRFDGRIETLHVISRHAGGEVRGYKRPLGESGPWKLRLPATPAEWREVDEAVARLVGAAVNGTTGVTAPASKDVGTQPEQYEDLAANGEMRPTPEASAAVGVTVTTAPGNSPTSQPAPGAVKFCGECHELVERCLCVGGTS